MKTLIVPALACSFGITNVFAGALDLTPIQTNQNPINIGLSALFAGGGSTVGDSVIGELQGGGHDPKRIGMNLQNLELTIGGAVDPYFDAQANIVMLLDENGESILEVEEAYMLSKRLPASLQIKLGQYYTEFGRLNPTHPHTWAFVDLPVISSRVLGEDGLRSQGGRISWLTPLPWYAEVIAGVQNAKGATGGSFLGGGHDHGAEEVEVEEFSRSINGLDDFLYSARMLNGFDFNDSTSANLGLSMVYGPNSQQDDTQTLIYGADFYVKWTAEQASRGYPFVAWHSEFMVRDYALAEDEHDAGHVHDHEVDHSSQKDSGWFSQVSYGFTPGWIAGVRLEGADSNVNDSMDPDSNARFRTALNLTWLPTEYSKIRLQYNYDDAEHLDSKVHSLWLQVEYNLGSHAAHVF